jgi:WD40 repeat protein
MEFIVWDGIVVSHGSPYTITGDRTFFFLGYSDRIQVVHGETGDNMGLLYLPPHTDHIVSILTIDRYLIAVTAKGMAHRFNLENWKRTSFRLSANPITEVISLPEGQIACRIGDAYFILKINRSGELTRLRGTACFTIPPSSNRVVCSPTTEIEIDSKQGHYVVREEGRPSETVELPTELVNVDYKIIRGEGNEVDKVAFFGKTVRVMIYKGGKWIPESTIVPYKSRVVYRFFSEPTPDNSTKEISGNRSSISSIAMNSDSQLGVIHSHRDSSEREHQYEFNEELPLPFTASAYDPASMMFAAASNMGNFILFSARKNLIAWFPEVHKPGIATKVPTLERIETSQVSALCFQPGGRYLFSSGIDGMFCKYEINISERQIRLEKIFSKDLGGAQDIHYANNLLILSFPFHLNWLTTDGETFASWTSGEAEIILDSILFDPFTSDTIVADWNGGINFISLKRGEGPKLIKKMEISTRSITALALIKKGVLFVASEDNKARLIDTEAYKVIGTFDYPLTWDSHRKEDLLLTHGGNPRIVLPVKSDLARGLESKCLFSLDNLYLENRTLYVNSVSLAAFQQDPIIQEVNGNMPGGIPVEHVLALFNDRVG